MLALRQNILPEDLIFSQICLRNRKLVNKLHFLKNTLYNKQINDHNLLLKSTIGRKGLERLDFLLLAIESIEINSVYSMLKISTDLGIDNLFPNSVELWKSRSHNPLRKATRRGSLSREEVDGLISLVNSMSKRIYPHTRKLLSSKEPLELNSQRWQLITERFIQLVSERMNLRRIAIQKLTNPSETVILVKQLIFILALSAGPGGTERLRQHIYES